MLKYCCTLLAAVVLLACSSKQKIIFEGNSLFADDSFYIPKRVFAEVNSDQKYQRVLLPIGGRTQTQINADIEKNILPIVKNGDIIILWEGTNDLFLNKLTCEQGFGHLLYYVNKVHDLGARVVVCTVIARDFHKDPSDMMDRIDCYNEMIRANASVFDGICDLALEQQFRSKQDCSDSTVYARDKAHQVKGGRDIVVRLLVESLKNIIST